MAAHDPVERVLSIRGMRSGYVNVNADCSLVGLGPMLHLERALSYAKHRVWTENEDCGSKHWV